jgi:hypothetical protein
MGYKLTSLVNLPIDENIDIYIFWIGDRVWEGGLAQVVHNNFDNIAREIGPQAIIVGGLTEEFHGEAVEKYLGKNHRELKNLMPALLITDAHPERLTEKSMRVIISLREAHEHYEVIDDFLNELAAFARGEDDQIIRSLEDAPRPIEVADEIVEVKIPVIPGVVAVNVNHAVNSLRRWWEQRREARTRSLVGIG